MKYLYRASFTDGTTFSQPKDDESKLKPGEKSSFYDFLEHCKGRELSSFALISDEATYLALHRDEVFLINGETAAKPGYPLPEGCEWVEGDPHQGVYFRSVTKSFNSEMQEVGSVTQFCIGVKHIPGVRNFLGVY